MKAILIVHHTSTIAVVDERIRSLKLPVIGVAFIEVSIVTHYLVLGVRKFNY